MEVRLSLIGLWMIFQLFAVSFVNGANILFFFGFSTYSHKEGVWPLLEKLSDRGHSLTFLSAFPNKSPHPKIQDFVPLSLQKWGESRDKSYNFFKYRASGHIENLWYFYPSFGIAMCEVLMNDPEYIDWVNSSKFDIIFVNAFWNECAYGMAYKMKAKIIVYSNADMYPHFSDLFGLSDESSWIPDMIYHYPQDMNIYQRFVTMIVPLFFTFFKEIYYFPKLKELMADKLGIEKMPVLSEIQKNVSLVFINQHYSEDYARPFPPNVIPIGGMRCLDEHEKLPKDMEEFIGKGDQGFIYISFGTYIQFSFFSEEIQTVFLNTVKKLKNIQFIWKVNLDEIKWTHIPQNVYIAKWMPQQAILAHPKIRSFITHGGLFGIQEAICKSVPLIAFPIFADQDYNAVKIESREIGLKFEITTITESQLQDGIHEILNDQKYHQNMKRVSAAFTDRPAKPVDTAVWWTEFLLRHQDTKFLRPGSLDQSWWKRRQLDIWAIIFLIISLSIRMIYSLLKLTFSVMWKRGKPVVNKIKLP